MKIGGKNSEKQHKTKDNTELFFIVQKVVTKLFCGYTEVASEARYRVIKGQVIKIITPKQILQRLFVALVPVETENTSQNLLSQICLIICSLYQSKEITKKLVIM